MQMCLSLLMSITHKSVSDTGQKLRKTSFLGLRKVKVKVRRRLEKGETPSYLWFARSKRKKEIEQKASYGLLAHQTMLASRLPQHLQYLLQGPCWHPGPSQLFSPHPYPKSLQLPGFPSMAFYSQ